MTGHEYVGAGSACHHLVIVSVTLEGTGVTNMESTLPSLDREQNYIYHSATAFSLLSP